MLHLMEHCADQSSPATLPWRAFLKHISKLLSPWGTLWPPGYQALRRVSINVLNPQMQHIDLLIWPYDACRLMMLPQIETLYLCGF